ncbi:MAG: DUF4836 family protein [Paraprevotella sp.]|nr:DUF4836 family protein [Paraprevotella sp.]
MKNKKVIGIVVILAVLCGGAFWAYRSFTAEGYLQALPSRPKALVSVDWNKLSKEAGLTSDVWKKLLPEGKNVSDVGIDWSKKAYAFVSSHEDFGFLLPVSDDDEVASFFADAAKQGRCTPVEEPGGCRWTVWGDRWLIGFNRKALMVMGPSLPADMDNLRLYILTCFRQSHEDSGLSSPVYAELSRKDDAVLFVSQLDLLPVFYDDSFKIGLPDHANLADVHLVADVHVEKQGVTVNAEMHSDNAEINAYYDRLVLLDGHLTGEYADYVPDDALAWGCAGLDGQALLKQLRDNPAMRTLLLGLNMSVDADLMIGSIKGDVAVTLRSLSSRDWGQALLTARLARTDFLKQAGYWRESAMRTGMCTFRDCGDQRFYLAANGIQAYFGVKDRTLYVTPDEALSQNVLSRKTEVLAPWKSEIKGNRFFLWVNLNRLKQQPEIAAFWKGGAQEGGAFLLDRFGELVLRSTDARHLTLELRAQNGINIWNELLK